MRCPNKLTHVVQQGDTLFELARQYQTTVASIMSLNPRLRPHNLPVGGSVFVCPGDNIATRRGAQATPQPVAAGMPAATTARTVSRESLSNDMREVWEQHVYWTRLLLVSIAARLNDLDAVTARLLQNPADIAHIYAPYYTPQATQTISRLLTEHLQIGKALIIALRDGQKAEAEALRKQWYANAAQLADAFASMNPYYNREEVHRMLVEHLDLVTREVTLRLAGDYRADIDASNKVESAALAMADYFSAGLIKQFPQRFTS